jgi:hypothetical protein
MAQSSKQQNPHKEKKSPIQKKTTILLRSQDKPPDSKGGQNSYFGQPILNGDPEAPNPIDNASPKTDGGSLLKIFGRASDLSNGVTSPGNLSEHLVVKNKIIGVFIQRE